MTSQTVPATPFVVRRWSGFSEGQRSFAFAVAAIGLGLAIGFLTAWRVIGQPGIIGLFHDWTIPPTDGQILTYTRHLFNGWEFRGLGAPLDVPADYLYWFGLAAAAFAGVSGSTLSKAIVVIVPALAFAACAVLGRSLGLRRGAALVCGTVYAMNPVMMNKLISGQSTYLFAYALLPLVPAASLRFIAARRRFAGGLAVGALAAFVFIQVQLGVVALAVVGVVVLLDRRSSPLARLTFVLGVAVAFFLVETPVLAALALNGSATAASRAVEAPDTLAWLRANSVWYTEALKLTGYTTRYDALAIGRWFGPWSLAAYAVAAAAIAGLASAPRGIRIGAAVLGAGTLLVVTGVYSPLGPVIGWAFVHVPTVSIFRELYHLMAVLALLYAVGVGFFWQSQWFERYGSPIRWATSLALVVFISPFASGDCGGFLRAQPYDLEMSNAYNVVAGGERRTAWFPLDQPLAFLGTGAGIDPMYTTPSGSLWQYSLTWPITAVDMYARSADWRRATEGMRALSVGWIVDRRDFESRLGLFLPEGAPREYYLLHALTVPRLSPNPVDVFPYTHLYPSNGLPLAYAASALAIVPQRLATIGRAAAAGYVPLTFGRRVPAGFPYVVVRDPGDELDEVLAGQRQIALPEQSYLIDAGFTTLAEWWYFTPAYGDAPEGVATIGVHKLVVPIGRQLHAGSVVVSWIGTPLGGRVTLSVGDRRRTIDTRASPVAWRATSLYVGDQPATAQLHIDTLDAAGAIAIRAVRAVDGGTLASLRADYAGLVHGAATVIDGQPPSRQPFRPLRSGTAESAGTIDAQHEYRLAVRCRAHDPGYVWANVAGDFPLAYLNVRPGRHTFTLDFRGVDDELFVASTCRIDGWNLSWRDADPVTAPFGPGMSAFQPGTFDGVGATFPERGHVAVLNVTYGTNWRASVDGALHVPTALGTNAWLLPAASGQPLTVRNAESMPFRIAFSVGLAAFLSCLAAPLVAGWGLRR